MFKLPNDFDIIEFSLRMLIYVSGIVFIFLSSYVIINSKDFENMITIKITSVKPNECLK